MINKGFRKKNNNRKHYSEKKDGIADKEASGKLENQRRIEGNSTGL